MTLSLKCPAWIAALTIALSPAARASEPLVASSPFADKYCDSYSNYRGADGKTVYPLWGDLKPQDFGSRTVVFDPAGIRPLNQIPAPGVHPRIFFTPSDLPDIRRRLKETVCGRQAWDNLLCWTEMMKGRYDDTQPYAKNDIWKGGFGGLHGPVPLFRMGVPRTKEGGAYNHNSLAAAAWQSLVDGTAKEFPPYYWNVIPLEAFRCLIENDQDGAKAAAKAAVTALRITQAIRESERASKHITTPPQEPLDGPHMGFQLAFTYDFLFNFLAPDQRQAMHDELAATTWSHDNYGTFNTAEGSRSNWATFSYWLYETLAIEGEAGFNDLKIRGMYRGWRNLFTYGWFQSGAVFEGEAKDQLGMDGVLMFAMRQKQYGFDDLCGHPYLRAYADNFLPKSVIPTQDGFIKYDLLGGAHGQPMNMDSLGLKYMFPDDKRVDWLYRCAMGEHYENVPQRPDGYRNDLLFFLAYATDFDPANNDPAKLGIDNTFFGGERALMMTRSGWDKDAMMLDLHVRQANGGHPFADRNAIMVAGAGRVWSPPGYATFDTGENSCVDIDGKTQSVYAPGRMVDFSDQPLATFAVGDASYAWDWNVRELDRKNGYYTVADARDGKVDIPSGWEPETHSIADFSYLKLPYAYLKTPLFENPHWILPTGAIRPRVRQPNYPVRFAFRTAGLVRGQYPYALVVDDIQKDDQVHHYAWTLAVEPDIQIARVLKTGPGQMDIYLTGNDPKQVGPKPKTPLPALRVAEEKIPDGQPMLLIRVLSCRTDPSAKPAAPEIVELPSVANAKKYASVRRLIIPADAVTPGYKVLIYPYRMGAALPQTAWTSPGNVSVTWPGQQDQIAFSPAPSGKTDIKISRGDQTLVSLTKPITPLP